MKRKLKFDESGDSEELQALFDDIAQTDARKAPASRSPGKLQSPLGGQVQPAAQGDSPELEALFDSLSAAPAASAPKAAAKPRPAPAVRAVSPAKAETSAEADSPELEALFDSVAQAAPARTGAPAAKTVDASGDSAELESLFDSVSAANPHAPERLLDHGPAAPEGSESEGALYDRLGRLTRELHDTLNALGHAELIRETAAIIPDAGDRLEYVTRMTEQAAARTLNAVDLARPTAQELRQRAVRHGQAWERAVGGGMTPDEFRALALETRTLFADLPGICDKLDWQLHEITMAQDFQDLTGQVIKKLVGLVRKLERDLVGVLVHSVPEGWPVHGGATLLNGPVIHPEESDVVTCQEQVDDLLESLGF